MGHPPRHSHRGRLVHEADLGNNPLQRHGRHDYRTENVQRYGWIEDELTGN